MDNKGFTVQAQLNGCANVGENGELKLGFRTKELPPEERVAVQEYFKKEGWLLFRSNPIQEKEVPDDLAEVKAKTPSQRLRATLFVYWKQNGEQGDFESFYKGKMEGFINFIKEKLI